MLNSLLIEYVNNSENDLANYRLGLEYERIGQTAAAVSFFLRAAERTTDQLLTYECLLRVGNCFSKQQNRDYTVKSMYNAALSVDPSRPEAYYLMSKQLEKERQLFECCSIVEMGLKIVKGKTFQNLNVGYPGIWALEFQKAFSTWWRGRGVESRTVFQYLFDTYQTEMDQVHLEAVKANIVNLGCRPESYIYRNYNRKDYNKLRYKFPGSKNIVRNFSQVYQDMFILSMLDGKKNGTFFEIGGAGPTKGNNTYLLEKEFGWTGVSVEYDENFAKEYREARPTTVIQEDALKINYGEVLSRHFKSNVIDYLQLDIEPAENTYECMKKIPFDEYKFRVITYEHDYYADFSRTFRELSRVYLQSKGYVLVVNDVSFDGVCTFEDWWVHPDLVDKTILEKMKSVASGAKDITKYMMSEKDELKLLEKEPFDWGAINNSSWFKDVVQDEIFVNDVYQKFVSVKKNDVVLDIGASVGPFAWKIKDVKPSKVICVEPHKELFKTLKKNVDAICVNKAIGSVDGIEVQKGLYNENLIYNQEDSNAQEVESIKFKTLMEENDISHVNFMKLDCEGGEYDIFNEENIDWILENVDYIAGEWHLDPLPLRDKFVEFRDKILCRFPNFEIYSYDDVNIKHDLYTDFFVNYYKCINVYIDNRKQQRKVHTLIDNRPKSKIKDKWKYSISPTLEFTTIVPEKGCVVDCVFCPQKTLLQTYKGERRLSLEKFKKVVDKLPKEVRVTFSGFVEPWMNSDCTDMLLYAHETGHPVSVFTTLVGMSIEDLERIKHIPFAGNPNGGFTVHLPDQELRAKHPINKKYIEVAEHLAKIRGEIQNLQIMSMGTVHEKVKHVFPEAIHIGEMWSRAGNLFKERALKPALQKEHFNFVDHGSDKQMTCGCDERLYHNVMLPNGDVSLCCMDYGLEEITGNLFESEYNDVIPDPYEVFKLCNKCENAIDVNSSFIRSERKIYNV